MNIQLPWFWSTWSLASCLDLAHVHDDVLAWHMGTGVAAAAATQLTDCCRQLYTHNTFIRKFAALYGLLRFLQQSCRVCLKFRYKKT